MKTHSLPVYTDAAMCRRCGGLCCMRAPGISFPEDWSDGAGGVDWRALEVAIASGRWVIDWWEGDPRPDGDGTIAEAYFVRPSIAHAYFLPYGPPPIAGVCIFHDEERGCTTPRRPLECRSLEPNLPHSCETPAPPGFKNVKQMAAVYWLPHHAQLRELERQGSRLAAQAWIERHREEKAHR